MYLFLLLTLILLRSIGFNTEKVGYIFLEAVNYSISEFWSSSLISL